MTKKYVMVIDAAQGERKGADSFAACVAHEEKRDIGRVAVQDCLFEACPPFSPRSVLEEIAATARRYHITRIHGDAHAAGFVAELLRGHGLTFVALERDRSALYLDALAMLNSGQASLLDHAKQRRQILALRRAIHSGGRVSVEHPRGGHDDVANVGLAALVVAFGVEGKKLKKRVRFSFGDGDTGNYEKVNDESTELYATGRPDQTPHGARAELGCACYRCVRWRYLDKHNAADAVGNGALASSYNESADRQAQRDWDARSSICDPRPSFSNEGPAQSPQRLEATPSAISDGGSSGGSPFDRGNDIRGPFDRR